MIKHHKIYYVPGMITLILLPVFCIPFLEKYNYEKRGMEIAYPSKYNPDKPNYYPQYDTSILPEVKNMRIYTNFILSGNDKADKIQLAASEAFIKQIVLTDDTIRGAHFALSDSTKYGTVIKILDLCLHIDSFYHTSVIYENDVWFWHTIASEEQKQRFRQFRQMLKTEVSNLPSTDKENLSFTEKIRIVFHDENIIKMKYFFLIFIIFSTISIYYIHKNHIKKL